jgi:nucleoside-triphosphatase
MSIFIFSRAVHSGKTSALLEWCKKQKAVYGILMPDVDGSRKIMNIKTRELFDIECTDKNTNEPLISVGGYNFYSRAFEKANNLLNEALLQNPAWLIIDECGKLELQGKGFYPSIAKAVSLHSGSKNNGNLIITVRDSLYAETIRFFHISNHILISNIDELYR